MADIYKSGVKLNENGDMHYLILEDEEVLEEEKKIFLYIQPLTSSNEKFSILHDPAHVLRRQHLEDKIIGSFD